MRNTCKTCGCNFSPSERAEFIESLEYCNESEINWQCDDCFSESENSFLYHEPDYYSDADPGL
jgi:hypothetical protein